MSVDHVAYAIIGVKIDARKLWRDENVRGCGHEPPDGVPYCPMCGKKVWQIKKCRILGFTESGVERPKLGRWHILVGHSNIEDPPVDAYVGIIVSGHPASGPLQSWEDEVPGLKAELKRFLEPRGLWPAEDHYAFGLWAVCYVSC